MPPSEIDLAEWYAQQRGLWLQEYRRALARANDLAKLLDLPVRCEHCGARPAK